MLFENGGVVGRCKWGSGEGEREGLSRVCNEDQSEFGGEGRREKLGEDGFSNSSKTDQGDWDRSCSGHLVDIY